MKNFTLFVVLFFITSVSFSQEIRNSNINNPLVQNKYANDVTINGSTDFDQRDVKIVAAFNGWLFAAFQTTDVNNGSGGISIYKSTDDGATWTFFDGYSVASVEYPTFDITIAGNDVDNLIFYVVGVNHNTSNGNYTIFVDKYNANTNGYIGSNFNHSYTTPILDVDIETDYRYPAVGASPYSVEFIYSQDGVSKDSIMYVLSVDGGTTFNDAQKIAETDLNFRKLSLAYGRSNSGSNGRYFAAWERFNSPSDEFGNIYYSRNASTVDGGWITELNLDSLSSSMIGYCLNPSISVQMNDVDNDSGSTSAIVLVQRAYNGSNADYDILGFYNYSAHYENNWARLDVVNTGYSDVQPSISYDPVNNNFLATYYSKTFGRIAYCLIGYNMPAPSSWGYISNQINDDSLVFAENPQIVIDPLYTQTAHAWINVIGGRGYAMFDGEFSVQKFDETNFAEIGYIYPNPVNDLLYIRLNSIESNCLLSICDISGKEVVKQNLDNSQGGATYSEINVSELQNGIYILNISSQNKNYSTKIVINH